MKDLDELMVEEIVEAGIKILDASDDPHFENWRSKIDLETLDVECPKCCILGQIWDYSKACCVLFGNRITWSFELGMPFRYGFCDGFISGDVINKEWKRVLGNGG